VTSETSVTSTPDPVTKQEPAAGQHRANIIGTGLVGGSIGLALRELGWFVSGEDQNAEYASDAVSVGAIDAIGLDAAADITFVAVPVNAVAAQVERALVRTTGVVTDVGSVKASVANTISDSRFVPGHPMAGSEQDGVKGARADLFRGATWVLTPGDRTAEHAYVQVGAVVRELGAEVITLDASQHDSVVAVVSHVPHLVASALMNLADSAQAEHQIVLRLAAGGFRDMTRIAAGHPGMWLDICDANSGAITEILNQLIESLVEVRDMVGEKDRDAIEAHLVNARAARVNLPSGMPAGLELAEVRVTIPDRAGELARLTTLAPEINIYDFEIAHSAEGHRGVGIMVVALETVESFVAQLREAGYRPSFRHLA